MRRSMNALGTGLGVVIVAAALADAAYAQVLDRVTRIIGEAAAAVGNEVSGWYEDTADENIGKP